MAPKSSEASGSAAPKYLGSLADGDSSGEDKKKKPKAKPKAAPKKESSSEEESDNDSKKPKKEESSSEEESSDGGAKAKAKAKAKPKAEAKDDSDGEDAESGKEVNKEKSTAKNKGAGKGKATTAGPREYKGGVDRTKSSSNTIGNDDEDERPQDAKERARKLAQEEADKEAAKEAAKEEMKKKVPAESVEEVFPAGAGFKPEPKPRSRPKVAKPAALPVPAEDREILTEIFSKYMSRGSARMQALDAASYLQGLQVAEPDRAILVEVLREQSDTGQDSLSKEEFVNWAGNYFHHNDPYENLVEIWRLVGGDRAGGGLVRLRDLQRVIEAWDLKLSREELEEFCGGGDTMNYDRFVHMLAGTDLKV